MFSESIKSAVSLARGESSMDIDGIDAMGVMGVILDLCNLLKNSAILCSYCIFGCRLSTIL